MVRLAVACVAIAALAVGLPLAVSALTGSGSADGRAADLPSTLRLSGRVVVIDARGDLATADPDGTNVSVVAGMSDFAQDIPAASADGRFLAAGNGAVVSLAGPVPSEQRSAVRLQTSQVVSRFGPFADHDRALVVLTEDRFGGPTATAGLAVADLSTGAQVPLGTADFAAGDPQHDGAFVSVPAPEPSPTGQITPPDSAVELRDAGVRPVTLVSAEQAAAVVGLDPATAVTLEPFPDAAGDSVAITVTPVSGAATAGIVIVDRSGNIEGEVLASVGIVAEGSVSWSPDGSSVAYVTPGDNRAEVATWTIRGGSTVRALPADAEAPFACLWSPDGISLVCPTSGRAAGRSRWYVMAAGPGPVAVLASPGYPVAWIGGRP